MSPRTLTLVCALAFGVPAAAQTPLSGELTATRDCPATVSIKQQDAAGGVRLEPGRAYRLLGKNRPQQATHYQVVIEGASPPERWVEVGCGTVPGTPGTSEPARHRHRTARVGWRRAQSPLRHRLKDRPCLRPRLSRSPGPSSSP